MNCLDRLFRTVALTVLVVAMVACGEKTQSSESKPFVSVSLPVEAYFVDRLAGDEVSVNVMIPQSAGHSDYSPLPSQMMALSKSDVYFAIGALDFELTWKDRIVATSGKMRWIDLNKGIDLIEEDEESDELHHGVDPHYWLSPKQVKVMAMNMALELKDLLPNRSDKIDSALIELNRDVEVIDSLLCGIEPGCSFMIYHPALTYLASDYGMTQFVIERHGNAPSPQSYMNEIQQAKDHGVGVVFVQQGYDKQKALSAADMIGIEVVEFNPEERDWLRIMHTIINALNNGDKR